jgi:hypothetical protein
MKQQNTNRNQRTTSGPELPSDGDMDMLQVVLEQAGRAHASRNSNLQLVAEYNSSGSTAEHNDRVRVRDDIGIPYIHSQAILTGIDEHGRRIVPLKPGQLLKKTILALKWLEKQPLSKYVMATSELCQIISIPGTRAVKLL